MTPPSRAGASGPRCRAVPSPPAASFVARCASTLRAATATGRSREAPLPCRAGPSLGPPLALFRFKNLLLFRWFSFFFVGFVLFSGHIHTRIGSRIPRRPPHSEYATGLFHPGFGAEAPRTPPRSVYLALRCSRPVRPFLGSSHARTRGGACRLVTVAGLQRIAFRAAGVLVGALSFGEERGLREAESSSSFLEWRWCWQGQHPGGRWARVVFVESAPAGCPCWLRSPARNARGGCSGFTILARAFVRRSSASYINFRQE